MGDKAKPFTMEVVERAYRHTPGFERAEDGVAYSLRATVEALEAERAKVRRLREELSEVIEQTKCVCGESWTGRSRHSPDCYGYVADSALKVLNETAEDA